MNHKYSTTVARMAAVIPEQRRDLDVSLRELASLSGVSRSTLTKIEKGKTVRPFLLVQVARTLTALELYTPPQDEPPAAMVVDLADRARNAWLVDSLGVAQQASGDAG